jgi:transcriptional regulator with XRE-family HTH domain
MRYRTALGDVLREERLSKNLNLREVSSLGCIALGYLSEVERGQKEISSELLESVAFGLGVAPHELVIKAGLLMASGGIPDTPENLFDNALAVL